MKKFKKNRKLNKINSLGALDIFIPLPNDVLNIIFSKTTFQTKRAIFCVSKYWSKRFNILNRFEARQLVIYYSKYSSKNFYFLNNKYKLLEYYELHKILYNINPILIEYLDISNFDTCFFYKIFNSEIKEKEKFIDIFLDKFDYCYNVKTSLDYTSFTFGKLSNEKFQGYFIYMLHNIFKIVKNKNTIQQLIHKCKLYYDKENMSNINKDWLIFKSINKAKYDSLIVEYLNELDQTNNIQEIFYFSIFYSNFELCLYLTKNYDDKIDKEFVYLFYKIDEFNLKYCFSIDISISQVQNKIDEFLNNYFNILKINVCERQFKKYYPNEILTNCVKWYARKYYGIKKHNIIETFLNNYYLLVNKFNINM